MALAITIRNVPDEVRNELASRAALKGWSLQQFLLHEHEKVSLFEQLLELIYVKF